MVREHELPAALGAVRVVSPCRGGCGCPRSKGRRFGRRGTSSADRTQADRGQNQRHNGGLRNLLHVPRPVTRRRLQRLIVPLSTPLVAVARDFSTMANPLPGRRLLNASLPSVTYGLGVMPPHPNSVALPSLLTKTSLRPPSTHPWDGRCLSHSGGRQCRPRRDEKGGDAVAGVSPDRLWSYVIDTWGVKRFH